MFMLVWKVDSNQAKRLDAALKLFFWALVVIQMDCMAQETLSSMAIAALQKQAGL